MSTAIKLLEREGVNITDFKLKLFDEMIEKGGGNTAAYETKAIISLLLSIIAKADTLEEVYSYVQEMASIEGVQTKSYNEKKSEIEKLSKKKSNNP